MTSPTVTPSVPGDQFYQPLSEDFTAPTGELLRTREVPVPGLSGAAQAWQVVYSTRTSFHAPLPASGLIVTPTATPGSEGASTLLYCPSFRGLGGRIAPSQLLPEAVDDSAFPEVALALERGWTVAIPDGQGLGMTGLGVHPFLSGLAAAHTVLDLARALPALADLDVSGGFVVWGYADGGRAALFAAEHHPSYAPDVDLRGVAAGAVPANPRALIADIDGGPLSGLAMAGLVGLARAYAHLPVTHVLTEEGRHRFAHAQTLTAKQLVATYRHIPLGTWCERREPWNDPLWRYVLAAEAAAHRRPQVPVHLYHGSKDGLIPIAMSKALFAEYRLADVDLSWCDYPTGHIRTGFDAAADALTVLSSHLRRRSTRHADTPPPQTT
ncbi:lipase family protein [Nocardia higoensis]|uniref:lipase family protein n=1 Tax=Nocardia higoensis TaxID=228599 RepID=UPI0002DBF291|nr:lipase family protein [Nocardia higoensis]